MPPFAPKNRSCSVDSVLGIVLRKLRQRAGLTQKQVAAALSKSEGYLVGQSYVSKIESGDSSISMRRLVIVAAALQCLPSDILTECERQCGMRK